MLKVVVSITVGVLVAAWLGLGTVHLSSFYVKEKTACVWEKVLVWGEINLSLISVQELLVVGELPAKHEMLYESECRKVIDTVEMVRKDIRIAKPIMYEGKYYVFRSVNLYDSSKITSAYIVMPEHPWESNGVRKAYRYVVE